MCSQAQVNHQKNTEARANFKPTNLDLNEAQRIFPMPKLTTHSSPGKVCCIIESGANTLGHRAPSRKATIMVSIRRQPQTINTTQQIPVWFVETSCFFNKYLLSISSMLGTANVNKDKQGTTTTLKKFIDKAVVIQ